MFVQQALYLLSHLFDLSEKILEELDLALHPPGHGAGIRKLILAISCSGHSLLTQLASLGNQHLSRGRVWECICRQLRLQGTGLSTSVRSAGPSWGHCGGVQAAHGAPDS